MNSQQFIAVWAYADTDIDVCLFTQTYAKAPSATQVKRDAFTQLKRLGFPDKFHSWINSLSQSGEVKIIPVRVSVVESVLREFVADVEAVGVTAVREQMQWPDLAATYEKAVEALRA